MRSRRFLMRDCPWWVRPVPGPWSEEWGYQAAHIVLRTCDPVDGIFCGSDQIARGVVDAVQSLGRRVPEDIAVVGTDNWSVIAEASRPPLTTVDLNLPRVGRLAARSCCSPRSKARP